MKRGILKNTEESKKEVERAAAEAENSRNFVTFHRNRCRSNPVANGYPWFPPSGEKNPFTALSRDITIQHQAKSTQMKALRN